MSFSCLSGYDPSGVTLESSIMSKFAIHGSIPQVQSAIATKLLQPDVTAQAANRFTTIMQGPGSISDRYARFRGRFRGQPPGAPD